MRIVTNVDFSFRYESSEKAFEWMGKSVKDNEIGWDGGSDGDGKKALEDRRRCSRGSSKQRVEKNISQRVLLKCSLNQIQSRATTHKKEVNQSFRKRKTEKNGSEKNSIHFFRSCGCFAFIFKDIPDDFRHSNEGGVSMKAGDTLSDGI